MRIGAARRRPVQREKTEQAHIVQLLLAIGGVAYVLGTRRRRGARCPQCATFVAEDQGTRQTPGIADLVCFLPPQPHASPLMASAFGPPRARRLLMVECKAPGGRLSPDQRAFQALCGASQVAHVVGGLDAVIAWLMAHGYLRADQVPHYRLPQEAAGA